MKFGVFTDLHYDAIPDADKRVNELIKSFTENSVDFIVDLGDSIFTKEKNVEVVARFKAFPCYFSIGNHNIDFCANETALNFLGLEKGHYSIIRENVKIIFLDANYVKIASSFIHEDEATKDGDGLCPYIPTEQIE